MKEINVKFNDSTIKRRVCTTALDLENELGIAYSLARDFKLFILEYAGPMYNEINYDIFEKILCDNYPDKDFDVNDIIMFEKEYIRNYNFKDLQIGLFNDKISFSNMIWEQNDHLENISIEYWDFIHYGKIKKQNR